MQCGDEPAQVGGEGAVVGTVNTSQFFKVAVGAGNVGVHEYAHTVVRYGSGDGGYGKRQAGAQPVGEGTEHLMLCF